MQGTCALCGVVGELQRSHIIPKFVFDWMKKTGGPHLRTGRRPNVRLQDGPTMSLLCRQCEVRLSAREKWFAENIFHPYIDQGQTLFSYGKELYQFCLSVLWRVLVEFLVDQSPAVLGNHSELCIEVRNRWGSVLLGNHEPIADDQVHLLMTDIGTEDGIVPARNWNRYIARAADMDVVFNTNRAFVYVKFARFLLFGAVTPLQESLMVGTKILPNGGELRIPQQMKDGAIGEFLVNRADVTCDLVRDGLSERQRRLIRQSFEENYYKIHGSDLWKALKSDFYSRFKPPGGSGST